MAGNGPLIPFPRIQNPHIPGVSGGEAWCERISPDPLSYGATEQIGENLTLMYPTLGPVPQRSDIFPMEGILRSQRFPEWRSDVSGFQRTNWATGLRGHEAYLTKCNAYISYFGVRTRSRAKEVFEWNH